MATPLDNPIWNSLLTNHAYLAIGNSSARRYPPEVAPFVGVASADAGPDLLAITLPGDKVGILSVMPPLTSEWSVAREIDLYQYVWEGGAIDPDPDAVPLGKKDLPAMMELTALVYPAYFREGTADLGQYFGFWIDGQLAAMAGVRMAMTGFQEISAVCTHPNHRGKGYAGRLSRHTMHAIQQAGAVPFLHTEAYNEAAQGVYEKLGLTKRATMPFRVMDRVG